MLLSFAPAIGKPYEGKPHVRFDEGAVETGYGRPSEAPFNRKGRETDRTYLRARRHRSTLQMRNVAVKIRKINRPHCIKEAKLIFGADNRKEALRRFKTWEANWFIEEERAVRCMRKDLFSCLHYYDFDKELWSSIRTTNVLERTFREIRRRTRPMNNFFTNEPSANRIMYGITDMLNKNWKGNSLKTISTQTLT